MRNLPIVLFASLSLAAQPFIAQSPTQEPAPQPPKVAVVGKAAPHFRVNDETGALTKVGGPTQNKNWTVLAFYPKASTGG